MKYLIILPIYLLMLNLQAQDFATNEVSDQFPFGQAHPDFVDQLSDFSPLIGECDCKSTNRNPDGTWQDTVEMVWRFKYIMDGKAIQDETWKSDGGHSGSIRQYIADSSAWAVTYFSSNKPSAQPGVWMGGATENGDIVLYKDHAAPNGMEGDSRLTFYNIDDTGYDWIGEWVDKAKTFAYPFWKIFCEKRE